MKILTVLGARPQFIKASIVSDVIKSKYKNVIKEIIVHTGQHYDFEMSNIFFGELKIQKPKYFLNVSKLNHTKMISKMIKKLSDVMLLEKPDLLIVYGDTNSTIAGALCASKLNIKIAHIESGLRSFNMNMQEEINRIVTDRISNLLFCPTKEAFQNLHKENFKKMKEKQIYNMGDVMLDVHLKYKKNIKTKKKLNNYYLCTLHREENCNVKIFKNIINNLNKLSFYKNIVFPAHPRLKKIISMFKIKKKIKIIKPQSYIEFANLIHNADAVITDSGGVQKESFFLKKRCFVLRKETEWNELVNLKFNYLINPQKNFLDK